MLLHYLVQNIDIQKLPCWRTAWSKLPCKTQPLKRAAQKILYSDSSIIKFIDKKIYRVIILKIPQHCWL